MREARQGMPIGHGASLLVGVLGQGGGELFGVCLLRLLVRKVWLLPGHGRGAFLGFKAKQQRCRNINLLSIAFGSCLRLRTD